MAWTAPRTWTVGQVLTAASLNTDIRDNLNYLRSNATNGIATNQTTASAPWVDLATVGPAVTVTTDTQAIVSIYGYLHNSNVANAAQMSFAVSGATTIAAPAHPAILISPPVAGGVGMGMTVLLTGLTPGSNTFTCKYGVVNGPTADFTNRYITVVPC